MKSLPALVAALGLVTAACPSTDADTPTPAPAEVKRAPEAPPTLPVVPVVSHALDASIRLPGELSPYEAVAIYPRVQAFVDKILVDRGSKVKSGDLLARLSAPELRSRRIEAEAKVRAAQSTASRLKAASSTPGAVAKNEVDVAESTLGAEEARARSLRELESYLVVRAPFDGQVTERNVHPGALVGPPAGPNAPAMVRIEQVNRLRLTVAVPEADVGGIADGKTAEFVVRAWPAERFPGIIRRVSRSVDARTRTMPVEMDVDNAGGKLAPGMFAEVLWPVRRTAPSLFVPPGAVAQTTERTYVNRVRDDVLEQVPVQRGVVSGHEVEVIGNLAPGDLVLARASEELKPGTKVKTRRMTDGGPGK
jgi:RND family efflux transporter MFP subunit